MGAVIGRGRKERAMAWRLQDSEGVKGALVAIAFWFLVLCVIGWFATS
jgi:hypothetical protein